MRGEQSRRRGVAIAWASIGLAVALACAHGSDPEPAGAPAPGAVAQAKEQPAASTCRDGNGNGPEIPLRWPVKGRVTSRFGPRRGKPHRGIDIGTYYGAAIRAAAPGRVASIERKRSYGRVVTIEHGSGYQTVYAHNQDIYVTAGARVEQGQVIADVGASGNASGPHLHFEVRIAEQAVDPLVCLPAR